MTEKRANELYQLKDTDDMLIAERAADLKMRHLIHCHGTRYNDRESHNRFLNIALRYVGMPLEELRDKTGVIATYIVGAREARGDK